jgi:hypothetical protein
MMLVTEEIAESEGHDEDDAEEEEDGGEGGGGEDDSYYESRRRKCFLCSLGVGLLVPLIEAGAGIYYIREKYGESQSITDLAISLLVLKIFGFERYVYM